MLTPERRKRILTYIEEHGAADVATLARLLGASESTVRRDLTALASQGQLHKFHGGAAPVEKAFSNREDSVSVKVTRCYEEKLRIARYAATLVNDDDFVFLDAGSTTFLMTRFLKGNGATFVTNGMPQAVALAEAGCHVMILGGDLKSSTEAVVGGVAAQHLQRYNFSKAFIGANGITNKEGFTTPETGEATVKAIAMERSFASFVLADHTKFGRIAAMRVAPLNAACVICDSCPEEIRRATVVKEVTEDGIHDHTESGA
ncbi:MAG: DeoR/GlpR transcriptional regulator [Clostridia bacterium]|nr:DeoR/GlpR transcriptional regulator [Clostridia bacterium]